MVQPAEKRPMNQHTIQIEHLEARVRELELLLSAHNDQKDQVESLREQLKFSEMARKVLERENTLLNQQVSQGHDQRIEQ